MSGINVGDDVLEVFNKLKLRKKQEDGSKAKYLKLVIKDEKICVDTVGGEDFTWDQVLETLKDDEPAYLVYDYHMKAADGRMLEKLVLVNWVPDNVGAKGKMLAGSTFNTVKEQLQGIHKDFFACDFDDMDEENVKKMLA